MQTELLRHSAAYILCLIISLACPLLYRPLGVAGFVYTMRGANLVIGVHI